MNQIYFATVARGLEEIAAKELESLGATEVKPGFAGVRFHGNKELFYRVNLWSRIIFRILVPIQEIKSDNADQLYKNVYNIDWSKYLQAHQTFLVNCTGSNRNLNHTHFTALKIKNAIVDKQTECFNTRSNIDVKNPDIIINAHINNDYCILSLDSSGRSLHRRGYRSAMGLAPLKETLAAALLDMANWDGNIPFLDPMCGSGVLPVEAALKGLNIAPGLYRNKFSFQNWLDFDSTIYSKIVKEAKKQQLAQLKAPIFGSDQDRDVIEQASINITACGLDKDIKLNQVQLEKIEAPTDKGIIICNPPYGKRIGNSQQLAKLYKLLGDVLKQRFKGWNAYILTANKELSKQIGLRTSCRIPVYNGSLPCTLLKYELY
ncbi:MAG: THUMP domain-containing class I SAM-dependent RNA methyltransferase [cyanobacterium endosymbiont of Rhopalodia musculus]|uniref:THUMP domain-containing class I SAM-dependent RNA methyltransferase n=1 Tax=cyanobacterium endosymbiont of Epithemia clementina EcSB TaxID=3034674 RepID=UPI0024809C5B|nr:THUMP domain-containing protein [cyanobacterium endosymbiont of Epithemia clementina EcSB]WGT68274.1 THUMP domain-containing protein [cyanobacterium endosymbiont of Epithemia clementina EcSB]